MGRVSKKVILAVMSLAIAGGMFGLSSAAYANPFVGVGVSSDHEVAKIAAYRQACEMVPKQLRSRILSTDISYKYIGFNKWRCKILLPKGFETKRIPPVIGNSGKSLWQGILRGSQQTGYRLEDSDGITQKVSTTGMSDIKTATSDFLNFDECVGKNIFIFGTLEDGHIAASSIDWF
ncbi:MAG: hypothetical protein H0T78_05490 [Longispora sp.]|nr:hypothetical protein [Longispora sp. (in: high G+C Gram-positive bacteria)]